LRTDFVQAVNQHIILNQEEYDKNMLGKLQEAAQSAPAYEPKTMSQPGFDATAQASRYAKAFSNDAKSGIEVVDVKYTVNDAQAKQYGRNDQVVVIGPN
jgi:hypothetical protein